MEIHGFWWKVSKNTEKVDFFHSPRPRTNICDSHNRSFSPRVKLLPWQHASAWRHVWTGGRVNGSSADHYFLLPWSTHDGIRCFRRSGGCLMCDVCFVDINVCLHISLDKSLLNWFNFGKAFKVTGCQEADCFTMMLSSSDDASFRTLLMVCSFSKCIKQELVVKG